MMYAQPGGHVMYIQPLPQVTTQVSAEVDAKLATSFPYIGRYLG